MADFLLVSEEDPVDLTPIVDGTGALQITHTTGNLADYSQTLHAKHTDLNQSSGLVMIKIFDFDSGGSNWQMNVVNGGSSWSRGTNYAYREFGPMTNPIEVDTTATSNASPPQTKTRKVWTKVRPADGQPDEPR